jgi:hypothetical protein
LRPGTKAPSGVVTETGSRTKAVLTWIFDWASAAEERSAATGPERPRTAMQKKRGERDDNPFAR